LRILHFILPVVLLSFQLQLLAGEYPMVEKGVLDLSNQQELTETLSLDGEWEFYWNKFILPGKEIQVSENEYILGKVPAYWTSYADDIPGISAMGYGSYRLLILFPEGFHDTIGFRVPVFDDAFSIYFNGIPEGQNGQPGKSKELAQPGYAPFLKKYVAHTDSLEIVIHVSNFNHRRGGFWKSMMMGPYGKINAKYERNKLINFSVMGVFFGVWLLFLVIFLLERRNLGSIYFSLTCLGILIRMIFTGFYPVNEFFELSWHWIVKLEYIGSFLTLMAGTLFLSRIFPGSAPPWAIRILVALLSIMILIVLLFQVRFFSYTIYIFQVMMVVLLGYYAVYSFIGMTRRRTGETLFFFALTVLLLAGINDLLVANSIGGLSNEYLSSLAFFVVISANAGILVNQWLNDYREKQRMHDEIRNVNLNLETIITKRTEELNKKNEQLETSLALKNKLFSIIAHDLKSPISTLAQYTDMVLDQYPDDGDKEAAIELRQMAYSLIDLVDNLLYWGLSQRQLISYQPEETNIIILLRDAAGLFRHQMKNKNINLTFPNNEKILAWCDPVLVSIVLRNLLSNAIKFTPGDGSISFAASVIEDEVVISLSDSGEGMSQMKIDELLYADHVISGEGTNREKGTGLGMLVTRDLVKLNGGKITIKSEPGRGTEIQFTLPGNHEK